MEPPAGTQEPGAALEPHEKVARALRSARRTQVRTGLALGVVVIAAIVLLIVQNGSSARLNWLAFHFSCPLWIMLLLTAAAGAVVWEAVKAASRRARRVRRERRDAVQAAQDMTQPQQDWSGQP